MVTKFIAVTNFMEEKCIYIYMLYIYSISIKILIQCSTAKFDTNEYECG